MAPSKYKKRKTAPAPLSPATEAYLREDEYAFQRVSAEAFNHEPGIANATVYGTRGQRQDGIDVIAYCQNGKEKELAQCRRYRQFGKEDLAEAIREYFEKGKRWQKEKVRRFVVITAADVTDRHLQDAVMAAQKRFKKKKIIFELWGEAGLCSKLNPYRGAVQDIYGGVGADRICGEVPETPAWQAATRVMKEVAGSAIVELEEERTAQLEAMRELSREGRHGEALQQVLAIKAGGAWWGYTTELRARFLRLEASMRLNLGEEVSVPVALVDQAKKLHPSLDYQVIDCYIMAHREGMARALATLDRPTSLDAWNMRWAFMLETGRSGEIAGEFKAQEPALTANAETRRLLALAALLNGDLATAQTEIAQAQAMGPKHRGVRLAAATIDYRSCLVPGVDGGVNLNWPVPVRWALVRRDPASMARLRRAAAEFAAIRALSNPGEAAIFRVWELGCLACDPSRTAEAEAFAQERLKAAPDDYRVAAWAVERDYKFDRAAVAAAMGTAIKQDQAIDLDAYSARCEVLISDRKTKAAERAWDEAEARFKEAGQHDVWKLQKVQFLARRGGATGRLVGSIKDANLQGQARIAAVFSGKVTKASLRKLGQTFAKEYEKSGTPMQLFQACDAHLRAGRPEFVAAHAKELVEKVPTHAALRMAVFGAYAAEKPELCLELLRGKQALLQDGRMTPELAQLRANCLQKIGRLGEAIQAVETAYRERPAPGSFAEFFRMLADAGDMPRAAVLARDLLTMPKAEVPLLLQVANLTRLQDLKLAQDLWRKAAGKPLKQTALLMGVVHMAFSLGLDREAAKLQVRLFKRAKKKGPLQWKTLEEVKTMMQERQVQQAQLSNRYDRSEVPIHLVARQVGAPLVQLYHGRLEENRAATDLTRVSALLARYGGRSLAVNPAKRILYADITGLLLAADLEVLDLVEEHLGPIHLAQETIQSLVQQIGECRPGQPSQHAWRAQLQQMVASGEIVVVETVPVVAEPSGSALGSDRQAAWSAAKLRNAVLATDWPLLSEDLNLPVNLPEKVAKETANLRELLVAAVAAGALEEAKLADHVGPHGAFRQYPVRNEGTPDLAPGKAVLLSGVPLEVLANQDLLKTVAQAFKVYILREDVERVAAEEAAHGRRMALADWTQGVLDRLKSGIESGRYQILPQTIPAARTKGMSLDAKGLASLLRAVEGQPDAAVWCDDRSVNRHALAGSRPSVDILEVLAMLRAKGALTEANWREKLGHLRRSNVRYVPTGAEEIQAALERAEVKNGVVIETRELSTLRRYYAACLLERGRMIGPRPGTTDLQEWNFILQLRQAVDTAFRELWESDLLADIVVVRSNWLWRWLYVDMVGLRLTVNPELTAKEEKELMAFQIGSMFTMSIAVPFRSARKGEPSARERYFKWLSDGLVAPLEHANPGFIESVAHIVAKDLERSSRRSLKLAAGNERKGQLLVMAKLFMDLPVEVRQHVNLPADVLAALGVTIHGPTVTVEGVEFDLAEFSAAQALALDGGTAELSSRDRQVTWKVARDGEKELTLRVTLPDGVVKEWRDPEFAALLPDGAERIRRMESLGYLFDCDRAGRRTAIEETAGLDKPVNRVLRLHEWRKGSPEVLYRELNSLLAAEKGVGLEDVEIPDWRRLLRHLHLPETAGNPGDDLATAAASRLKEDGLKSALRCFMAIPRKLPEVLETAWRELPAAEAKELWVKLPRFPRSVVTDLHLVRLGLLRNDVDRAIVDRSLGDLFDREKGEALLDSFFATLRWVEREFIRWPQHAALPPWQRLVLVWYHAGKVHGIFRATRVDLPKMEEFFRANTSSWHHGVMDYEPAYARDVSHPSLAGEGSLLLNGLANLLRELPEADLGLPAKWQALVDKDAPYAGGILLDLCRRTDLATDALGAFLARPPQAARDRLFGEGWDRLLKEAGGYAPLADILQSVAKDPYGIGWWSALLAAVRELPLPAENQDSFRELIRSLDWEEFAVKNKDWSRVVMNFAAAQARFLEKEFQEEFEETVFRFATSPARAQADEKEASQCDLHLLQCLLSLAIEPGDQAKTAERYFVRIGRLMRVRPGVAALLERPLRHWLARLPFEQQKGLRALWYQLRAQR
ncbi:hypothetical protein ESB00_17420 [Oleiharenicola lentus]|uniref:HTH domain-containing protein n=1 Tax=Oleiharenicola lentus TaxID=2508720 RepID=A0A4Q1C4X7_9BACT|nr:hypothetical protein [Oleiharenicola lentus]RXK53472.1 hypothetical protein ESB00_17420 [Oleiharenicola lentus]